jgi:AAA+ ATPase superfamily predicted ATPase
MGHNIENPFTNYGRIVSGSRFIGRKEGLAEIENRVLVSEPSNLAIIGEPRIGKSSLAYQATVAQSQKLLEKKFLPIRINLGTYQGSHDFFYALPKQCMEQLGKQKKWLNASIRSAAKICQRAEKSGRVDFEAIKYFFERVRLADIRVLFLLDEFDDTRRLFKNDDAGFQRLRELSYAPESGVTYLTTSRRSIRQIELQTGGNSTLDGIFPDPYYLGPFVMEDVEEYFARLSAIGLPVTPELKEKADFYTGGHPFLLDILNYEIVESYRKQGIIDVESAYQKVATSFTGYYEHLERLLDEESNLNKLLQIVIGPVVDVREADVYRLQDYGLVRTNPDGTYSAFSQHFQAHLRLIGRNIELWPMLGKTEKLLRLLIEQTLQHVYGDQWLDKMEQKHVAIKDMTEECRRQQKNDKRNFGQASQNVLDYTYFRGLFKIISLEWDAARFMDVFRMKKAEWNMRADFLAMVRNPLAHHRGEIVIKDFHRQQAEGYCGEILNITP